MTDPSLLILSSLADGDKHGYAITEDVAIFAGVRIGPGTLYAAIARLETRGLIRGLEFDDRRRPYRLTADGRRYLLEELAALKQVVRVGLKRLKPA